MTNTRFPILDSAFAISALTAGLFFWGLVNIEGDANALGLPRIFLSRDLWGTVAYGAEGFFAHTLLLPFLLYRDSGIGWFPLVTLVVGAGLVLLSATLIRRWRYRFILTVVMTFTAISVHITFTSFLDMANRIDLGVMCLTKNRCDRTPVQNRVLFAKNQDSVAERSGIIMSANDAFMVLLTESGLFVLPMSSIKFLETAKQPAGP